MTQTTSGLQNIIAQVQPEFERLIAEKHYLLNIIQNSLVSKRVANDIGAGLVNNTKYEWQEQKIKRVESLITADSLSGSSTIAVADGSIYRVGSILKFFKSNGDEIDFKSIVLNVVGDNLTVNRVIAGTDDDLLLADGIKAFVMSNADNEGLTYTGKAGQPAERKFNYTQVITESVDATKSALLMNTYDKQNDLSFQIESELMAMLGRLEYSLIDNPQFLSGDIRSFGGLKHYVGGVDGIKNSTPGTDIQGAIDNLFEQILERGGMSANNDMVIVCNYNNSAKISKLTNALTQKQQVDSSGMSAPQNLGNYTATYTAPYFVGSRGYGAKIISSQAVRKDEILLIDANKVGFKYVSPLALLDTSVANVRKKQLSLDVELTLCVENGDDSHGLITNLA